jgi:hypothetical protein
MLPLKSVALLLVLLASAPAPDEGQWLPEQLLAMDWEALRARGLELTRDEFWHPEKGGILSATVQINGCSAALISPEGLAITNHHCAFGAIQRNSTVEKNYIEEGFVAASREEELPAHGIVLRVVRKIEDVTAEVHEAQAAAKTDLERYQAVQQAQERIAREAEQSAADTECQVSSFFNGRKYLLYYRTRIPDVRLVAAPPRGIGEFGGETDNWMWPRHTGDFTLLRAYVGPDGKPARYSKQNVPYQPKHWMKVSGKGVKEGDLVMILGYPGRTERYLTSVAVASRQENQFPARLDIYTRLIEVMEASAAGDPERALAISSTIKSLANVQKNALGMVKGLPRNEVVRRKLEEEQEFSKWVAADPERNARWGTVLDELLALDREAAVFETHDLVLGTLLRYCPLVSMVMDLCYAAEEGAKPEEDRDRGYSDRQNRRRRRGFASPQVSGDLETVEKPVMGIVLDHSPALPEGGRLGGFDDLAQGSSDVGAMIERLYGESEMTDPEARVALFDAGFDAIRESTDPMVVFARGLASDLRRTRLRNRASAGRRLVVGARWIEAQEAWRGKAFYPDANSTLRISVASVKGYSPFDGAWYVPHTTLKGVLAKNTGEPPFNSPPALLAAARQDLGRFASPELGDVPVCFLSDGDTTGGNSGSPVINGKGELVGVNFDRVFENIPGDFGWNADRSRNVSVDLRYVLWLLDKVMPAPQVLKELGF